MAVFITAIINDFKSLRFFFFNDVMQKHFLMHKKRKLTLDIKISQSLREQIMGCIGLQ